MFFQGMIDCYGYVLLIGALLVVIGALYGVTYEKGPDAAVGGYKMGQEPQNWAESQKTFARALVASGALLLCVLVLVYALARALDVTDSGILKPLAIVLSVIAVIAAILYAELKGAKK